MNNLILGTCRLKPFISDNNNSRVISKFITRPTNTKEHLQLIKFMKYNNLTHKDFFFTFERCINNKTPINQYKLNKIRNDFFNYDYYIIEICSSKCHVYDNRLYSHYTAVPQKKDEFTEVSSWLTKRHLEKISLTYLSFEEIEEDILEIQKELDKPIIIVSHFVIKDDSKRFELKEWLKTICKKHNIVFIDPVKEMKLLDKNFTSEKYFKEQDDYPNHLTDKGNNLIKKVFQKFKRKIKIRKN